MGDAQYSERSKRLCIHSKHQVPPPLVELIKRSEPLPQQRSRSATLSGHRRSSDDVECTGSLGVASSTSERTGSLSLTLTLSLSSSCVVASVGGACEG